MTITVSPTTAEPTHHISLSDGTTTYGIKVVNTRGEPDPRAIRMGPINRQAFKISQGESKYGDLEFPYSTVIQQDWTGGRGSKEFELDTTKYYDAEGVNTLISGRFFPGAEPFYHLGLRAAEQYFRPQNASNHVCDWVSIKGKFQAVKFTATASTTLGELWLWVKCTKTAYSTYNVYLYSDSTGVPGTALVTTTLPAPASYDEYDDQDKPFLVRLTFSYTTVSTTQYWLVFYGAGGTTDTQEILRPSWTTGNRMLEAPVVGGAPGTWATPSSDVYRLAFRWIPASEKACVYWPFEYKGALYCLKSFDDNSTAEFYINGYAGVCDAGSTSTVINVVGTPFTVDALIGCIFKITRSVGVSQSVNYRTITDNTTSTITVSPAFDIVPDSTTNYVIIGYDGWNAVGATGSLPTKSITDVKVMNGAVYFCQGEDTAMVRFIAYNNAGTWTKLLAAETEKATFITQICNEEGSTKVWMAKAVAATVAYTDRVDCTGGGAPAALGAGSVLDIGDKWTKITGIEGYGEPMIPWVFKEDSLWNIANKIKMEVPLSEMKSVSSENNGVAHCTQGVYLYFSLLNSMERFYKNNLDDLNPGRDGGLPTTPYNRNGIVRQMVSYPGKLFLAIDAGTEGQSSVLVWDGVAYHEYYRAPHGLRIRNIYIQSIPGVGSDKLWVSVGPDLISLDIALNPLAVSDFHYKTYGSITFAKMGTGMLDLVKFWKSVKVFVNGPGDPDVKSITYKIAIDYKADDQSAWVTLGTTTLLVPTTTFERDILTAASAKVNAKCLQIRIRYENHYTPTNPLVVRAINVENVIFVPVKFSYGLTFNLQDNALDLNGDDDSYTAAETLSAQLIAWARAGTILTLRSVWSWMDNISVRIDPISVMGLTVIPDDQMETNIASMTLSDA